MVRDSGYDAAGHPIPSRELSSEGDRRVLTDTNTFEDSMNWHMALATKVGIGFLRTERLLFPHNSLDCFEARLRRVEETKPAERI